MYAGEVVERGTVREIFHDARHPYTRKLIACDPARIAEPTRDLPTIRGELPNLVAVPEGCIFKERCDLRFERCDAERPGERGIGAAHKAACHRAERLNP
jgi:oligopeptide/dipeptide ABC transporter ATP-binding protein